MWSTHLKGELLHKNRKKRNKKKKIRKKSVGGGMKIFPLNSTPDNSKFKKKTFTTLLTEIRKDI